MAVVVFLGLLDVCVGHFVARPLGILHRSANRAIGYENVPGTYVGRQTMDAWKAPLFVIWDLIRSEPHRPAAASSVGSTLYRIDDDGCRARSAGPLDTGTDVVLVGSSQAFGMLVSAENSVPGMLEGSLRTQGFAGLRVANCSVVGHRFLQTLASIERAVTAKHPRLTVTLVRPWHLTEPFPYMDVLAPQNEALRWLADRSSLVRLAHYYSWKDALKPAPLSEAAIASGLDAFALAMRNAGARSMFVLLDDGTREGRIFDGLKAQLRERGFIVERVRTPSGPASLFIDHERHWSVSGGAYTTAQLVGPVGRELEAAGVVRTQGP